MPRKQFMLAKRSFADLLLHHAHATGPCREFPVKSFPFDERYNMVAADDRQTYLWQTMHSDNGALVRSSRKEGSILIPCNGSLPAHDYFSAPAQSWAAMNSTPKCISWYVKYILEKSIYCCSSHALPAPESSHYSAGV